MMLSVVMGGVFLTFFPSYSHSCDQQVAKAAAEAGDPQAQYSYAQLLYSGIGGERNLPEAFYFFHLASEQGIAEAKEALENLDFSEVQPPASPITVIGAGLVAIARTPKEPIHKQVRFVEDPETRTISSQGESIAESFDFGFSGSPVNFSVLDSEFSSIAFDPSPMALAVESEQDSE